MAKNGPYMAQTWTYPGPPKWFFLNPNNCVQYQY